LSFSSECGEVKPGCPFRRRDGSCTFKGGKGCLPLVLPQCLEAGCRHTLNVEGAVICIPYNEPALRWKNGVCPFVYKAPEEGVLRINPLKETKRKSKSGV